MDIFCVSVAQYGPLWSLWLCSAWNLTAESGADTRVLTGPQGRVLSHWRQRWTRECNRWLRALPKATDGQGQKALCLQGSEALGSAVDPCSPPGPERLTLGMGVGRALWWKSPESQLTEDTLLPEGDNLGLTMTVLVHLYTLNVTQHFHTCCISFPPHNLENILLPPFLPLSFLSSLLFFLSFHLFCLSGGKNSNCVVKLPGLEFSSTRHMT